MTLDRNDIGALTYIARRIREQHHGATKWDEPGIAAGIRRMVDRGFGFDEILDQVVNHARDKSAKNPGVLGHPISGQPVVVTSRRNPMRADQCPSCGLRTLQCVCDPTAKRKPAVDSTTPEVQTALGKAREALAAAKGAS